MDDQQTYLLNGLLTRHFGLGRIVRFRPLQRGRQAESFELFTAQEKQYLVQLYPPAFTDQQLNFVADTVNRLDQHRFSVVPFVMSKSNTFVAEGPQNSRMLVSLAPSGSALDASQYTVHDISQLGLRLGWLHRLLREQLLPPATEPPPIIDKLRQRNIVLPDHLSGLMRMHVTPGWTHGDIQLQAILHDGDHQLSAVVDWGLMHWGTPLTDIVDAFVEVAFAQGSSGERGRGSALLEAYDTLLPLKRTAWTPVVAHWCGQRLLSQNIRPLPVDFEQKFLAAPERLATAIASCL